MHQEINTALPTENFWAGRRVFVTGHTGFKGSWLFSWLQDLGSHVCGYSLAPTSSPNLHDALAIPPEQSVIGDIRDNETLQKTITEFAPEVVFHMAAQALVRQSYKDPRETYSTNVIGTQNLLEAVRATPGVKVVINITSDKVYENREWEWGYRENDALGGFDPYSASKACADILARSYQRSFFQGSGCRIATARAGNVIGGGDWSVDRLVPDAVRAFEKKSPLIIRSPNAVRPWQHVLEPLCGYLLLAERCFDSSGDDFDAWNFGPGNECTLPVKDISERLSNFWGDGAIVKFEDDPNKPHEANLLKLDASRATSLLNWKPVLDILTSLKITVHWYKDFLSGVNAQDLIRRDITLYRQSSKSPASEGT